jgi:hypothetical protein
MLELCENAWRTTFQAKLDTFENIAMKRRFLDGL